MIEYQQKEVQVFAGTNEEYESATVKSLKAGLSNLERQGESAISRVGSAISGVNSIG